MAIALLAMLLVTVAMVVLRLLIGEDWGWPSGDLHLALLRPWRALVGETPAVTKIDLRLFRVTLACLAGMALATSGVALQALLRNPLAEPFILGLSTGATVGVLALQWLAREQQQVVAPQHVGAMVGATVSMLVVYVASRRCGMLDPLGLLLVGVVLSTINGAIVMLLYYIMRGPSPPVDRWMMGHLNEHLDAQTVWIAAATILASFTILLTIAPSMDVATFSDAEAQSMGVHLGHLRAVLFAAASVLAGAAVVLTGPLAFVGFVCPHLARLMFGPAHRVLLLASAMIGAILILLADVVIVSIDAQWNMGQLPIGIFTAMAGGIVFLWMLRSKLGQTAG